MKKELKEMQKESEKNDIILPWGKSGITQKLSPEEIADTLAIIEKEAETSDCFTLLLRPEMVKYIKHNLKNGVIKEIYGNKLIKVIIAIDNDSIRIPSNY